TQQFVTLDVTLAVGGIEESITVTGQSPLIDTSTASTGGVLDRQALESLPSPGRNAFLIGITIPTFTPVGDPQFNRQQDQSNASIVSLGGGEIGRASCRERVWRSGDAVALKRTGERLTRKTHRQQHAEKTEVDCETMD